MYVDENLTFNLQAEFKCAGSSELVNDKVALEYSAPTSYKVNGITCNSNSGVITKTESQKVATVTLNINRVTTTCL